MDLARTRVALDMLAVQGILADPTDRRLNWVRQAWDRPEARNTITSATSSGGWVRPQRQTSQQIRVQ